jgi:hypothetical protein
MLETFMSEEVIEIARVEPILLNLGHEIMETPDWAAVEKVVAERYDVDVDRFDVSELKPVGKRVKRRSDGKTVLLTAQREPGGAVTLYEYFYE